MDYTAHGALQATIRVSSLFPSPEDLPNPGIEPRSPTSQVDSLPAETPGKPNNRVKGGEKTGCCSLNACVPPGFLCCHLTLQSNGIRRWGLEEVIWSSGQSLHEWDSVQFSSVIHSCKTLSDLTDRSTPGFPVHHQTPGA